MRMSTGDHKPDLELTLKSKREDVDATAVPGIRIIGTRDGVIVIDAQPATKTTGTHTTRYGTFITTILAYEWADGDTDLPGIIEFEVEVTWPGNKKQTFEVDDVVEIELDADA